MAEQEAGFLARLTGSEVDEKTIARQQINQAIANPHQGNAGLRQMMFGLGQQAGGGLGAAAKGAFTGIRGREEGEGFFDAANRGTQDAQDKLTARAVGITPNELKTRRRIRTELGRQEGDSSVEGRLKMAQRAAQIAADNGDAASLGRALSAVKRLKQEQVEFDKLSAESKITQFEADTQGIRDVWLAGEATPRTAQITSEGAAIENDEGEAEIIPIGQFSMTDPTDSSANRNKKTFAERYNIIPASARTGIANIITATKEGVRTFGRVLDSVRDWAEQGGAESIMSTSGKALITLDNAARNIVGFARAFVDKAENPRDRGFFLKDDGSRVSPQDEYLSFRTDLERFNIPLPEGVTRGSAAAQNYQAQLINLAYAVARMREPSNRGLSDNDVKLAMESLTATGSNPQVIFRRFTEMLGDAAVALDDSIGVWDGYFTDIMTPEEFRTQIGGSTLERYDRELADLFEREGLMVDETGRAILRDRLDVDVAPGEGLHSRDVVQPEDFSNEDVESLFFVEPISNERGQRPPLMNDFGRDTGE